MRISSLLNSKSIFSFMLVWLGFISTPAFSKENATHSVNPPSSPKATEGLSPSDELIYRTGIGRADDVKLLIKKGANPNISNNKGVPLLSVAANRKDSEAMNVIRALLEGGADVNMKNKNGQTALFYAAKNGNAAVVQFLMQKGVDYYALDNDGNIARTYAFNLGHTEVVDLMDNFVKSQTTEVIQKYKGIDNDSKQAQKDNLLFHSKNSGELTTIDPLKLNLETLVYDISYNTCAFQYWSYCKAAELKTDLTQDSIDHIIDNHSKNIQSSSKTLMEKLNVGPNYISNIIEPSKRQVYDQLDKMPSSTYRTEHGIGTQKDLEERCNAIAENWKISSPKGTKKESKDGAPTKKTASKEKAASNESSSKASTKRVLEQESISKGSVVKNSSPKKPHGHASQGNDSPNKTSKTMSNKKKRHRR